MFTRSCDFRERSFAINCQDCDKLILSLLFDLPNEDLQKPLQNSSICHPGFDPESMTHLKILDSRRSLPSNVLIGGGNDKIAGSMQLCKDASQNLDYGNQCVRLFAKDSAEYDWDYIVAKMRQEGIAETIFHNLKKNKAEHLVPLAISTVLTEQYYNNLRRNLSIIGELKSILTLLKESGIPCIVLKGIALAEHIYPAIAMRGMSDIDILVKKSELYAVDDLLSSQEYIAKDSSVARAINNPEGYLASLEYRKENGFPLNLHVHWHTVNSSVPATMFGKHVDLGRIWEKAVPARVADADVYMLCPEHLIIYLCEHALRIGHSFDRLILITDIAYALKAYEKNIDWDFLLEESRRFNLDRFVYFSLSIVKSYARAFIPEECLRKLMPLDLSLGERFFLRLQTTNRRIRGSSYFVYLAMNRTVTDKIKFLFRTFFPPRQILLQRLYIRDGATLKSYYTARVREIVFHIFSFLPSPEKTLKRS